MVDGFKMANMRHHTKFSAIGPTVAEIWRFFDFSKWDRPPYWIYYARVWTTHEGNLVVFIN